MNQFVQIRVAKAQIGDVLEALAHHLDEGDEALKLDMLEGETVFQDVVSRLLAENEDDEGVIAALDAQIDVRAARKERMQSRIDARKKAISSLMDTAQITKLPLPEATLSLRTLAPKPIITVDELPDEFVTVETVRKPNREAIKEAVESGETIPGVIMSNGGSSLTVRRK